MRCARECVIRGSGGTGRRARLRGVWFTPYGFKSRFPHQKEAHISLPDKCVLFSTKFAFGEWNMASPCEIAPLWNICFANVKWRILFHIATKEQYFTMCDSTLFHIRRTPNISLNIELQFCPMSTFINTSVIKSKRTPTKQSLTSEKALAV